MLNYYFSSIGLLFYVISYLFTIIFSLTGYSAKGSCLSKGSKLIVNKITTEVRPFKINQLIFSIKVRWDIYSNRMFLAHLILGASAIGFSFYVKSIVEASKIEELKIKVRINVNFNRADLEKQDSLKRRLLLNLFSVLSLIGFIISASYDVDFRKPINDKIEKRFKVMPAWYLFYVFIIDKMFEANLNYTLFLNLVIVLVGCRLFIKDKNFTAWRSMIVISSVLHARCLTSCVRTRYGLIILMSLAIYFPMVILI